MNVYSRILSKLKLISTVRRCFSTKKREYEEVCLKVPWGHISGKWWEPYDTRPILCLHGWQDNCGTFDRLIPMLNSDVGFLAVDFPGHGYSSKLPQGICYLYNHYLMTIRGIKDNLKWPKITLLGHSMGGVTSCLFTLLQREEVDFLMCLDGFKAFVEKDNLAQIAKNLTQFLRYHDFSLSISEPISYSLDEMVKKVSSTLFKSIKPEYAYYILERNIAQSERHTGKYYFTRDPRVKNRPVYEYSQEELIDFAKVMTLPILVTKAKSSFYFDTKKNYYEFLDVVKNVSINFEHHYVEGKHHMHLNNPQEVAPLLVEFIRRYAGEDRTVGGIRDDVITSKKENKLLLN